MSKQEKIFYVGFGALTLILASLPYLIGAMNAPPGHVFTGLTYNQDDGAVYLSWLRQAADGQIFQRNLFNTDPQRGALINVWSLLLGNVAQVTGLSLPAVYHLARVGFGATLLWAVVCLLREMLRAPRARQVAFALVCVSGGLGWLTGGFDPARGDNQPVDLWQPEALSFLSLYYSPLFLAALTLIAVFVRAVLRAERSGDLRDVWPAAASGALLANFHSYDVIPLFLTWFVFRFVRDGARGLTRETLTGWGRLIAVLVATLPFLGYQYYALIQDPLFRARDVKTISAAFWWVLIGLGLPLALAVVEAARRRGADAPYTTPNARRWLLTWAVVGVLGAYLPVDFQRKLIMGAHLPLCLLAGVALDRLTAKLTGDFPKIAVGAAVLLTFPGGILFLLRDSDRVAQNVGSTENRPYLTAFEADALAYLRQNARPGDAVLCSPDATSHRRFPFFPLRLKLAVYVPAYTGLPVYVGHGSETAAWARKWQETVQAFRQETSQAQLPDLLARSGAAWILYDNRLADGPPADPTGAPLPIDGGPYVPVNWAGQNLPRGVQLAYRNPEITVLRVVR